ncbi:MAG: hypothetical protein CSB33_03155 [Desulfobacterales bacterium]|nr:MAG: hypothetical protein CSB33_03155 [Desulfobacterales bacterium]
MRLRELRLKAVGPFSDTRLCLAPAGLHLVYGSNEAGKSSALRALISLLYGFPVRTPDDFRHSYGRLRVGGVLEDQDGRRLHVTRRKGKSRTLRDGEDSEFVPESAIKALLGDVDRDRFQAFFGIDHPRLAAGGRDIIRGGGRLGELLFAAGAGMVRFHELQERLRGEAAEIYGPRSRKPRLNAALKRYADLRREVRTASLSRNEWEERRKSHEELIRRRDELAARMRRTDIRLSRLSRLAESLPLFAERDRLAAALADLEGVPDLGGDFTDRRREAQEKERAARDKEEMAVREHRRVIKALEVLPPPGPFPSRAGEIRRLYKLSDAVAAMEAELPGRRAAARSLAEDAAHRAADLFPDHPDRSPEALAALFPDRQQREIILSLAGEAADLQNRITAQQTGVRRAEGDLARIRAELDLLPPSGDTEELAAALSLVRRREDTPRRLEELEEETADLFTEARRLAAVIPAAPEKGEVPSFSGAVSVLSLSSLERISRCRPPASEEADVREQAVRDAEARLSRIKEAEAAARTELLAVTQDLRELDLAGAVPAEADLTAARRARAVLWRRLSGQWKNGAEDRPGDWKEREEKFIAAVRHADDIADRLRREARRVSRRAALAAREQTLDVQLAGMREDRDTAREALAAARRAWADLWRAGGLVPGPPAEMRPVPAALAGLGEALRRRERLERRRQALTAEWDAALAALRRAAGETQETAMPAELIRRAVSLLDRQVRDAEIRERLTADAGRLSRVVSEAQDEREGLRGLREKWRERWAAAVAPAGLRPHLPPERVIHLLTEMEGLAGQMTRGTELAAEIRRLENRVREFDAGVRELSAELTGEPPDAGISAHRLAERLQNELGRAGEIEVRRKDLLERKERQRTLMEEARAARSAAKEHVRDLCREAGVEDVAQLPEIESRSRRAHGLRGDIEGLERRLVALASDLDFSAFREEAKALDASAAESEIRELTRLSADMAGELSALDREIGRSAGELERMDGRADAARKAQEARSVLADIRREADRYACLQLAASVLEEAVESYRKTHQGPVVGRAGDLFHQMTAGAFSGIGISVGAGGEPVVTGIRSAAGGEKEQGEALDAAAMSDGTADQLYLAIRLASLELYLETNPPMPFIADDILIQFDDERALATLRTLADLGRRTQIIFFTHHRHLIELGRDGIPEDRLITLALDHRERGKERDDCVARRRH